MEKKSYGHNTGNYIMISSSEMHLKTCTLLTNIIRRGFETVLYSVQKLKWPPIKITK
jgi:hypothetical protein